MKSKPNPTTSTIPPTNQRDPFPATNNWKLQDALMRENGRCGLRPLLFLAYGHPRYDASSGPSETCKVYSVLTPEGIAGYAAWAGEVARRYRGRQVMLATKITRNLHPSPHPSIPRIPASLPPTIPISTASHARSPGATRPGLPQCAS